MPPACSRRAAHVDISASLGSRARPDAGLHARADEVIPVEEGRLLASGIPGAEFVELDSRNHILLEHEPAWLRFREAVSSFLSSRIQPAGESPFAALSARERQVLKLMADGLSNADIAAQLQISDKTVRNHASNCSTSWACGHARRRSCLPVTTASGSDQRHEPKL